MTPTNPPRREKDAMKPWQHFVLGLFIVFLGLSLSSSGEPTAGTIALALTLWWFYG